MASGYVLLQPRCSLVLPLLMLLIDRRQRYDRVELDIPAGVALCHVAHCTMHTLVHLFQDTLIETRLRVAQPKDLIISDTKVQSWHVIDNLLSNLYHLRKVHVRWERGSNYEEGFEFISTHYPCESDVLEKILPRCLGMGVIDSLCRKEGCKLHGTL